MLGRDLTTLGREGQVERFFELGRVLPAPGFWVELAGGVLALAAGLLALLRIRSG